MNLKDKAKNKRRFLDFLKPDTRTLLTLFVVSLAFRLIFLFEISDMPTFEHPIMDENYHVELAQEALDSASSSQTPYYRAPLYPYFMTALMWLGGGSLFFVRLIQVIIGSLLPPLLFILGCKFFEKRSALLAASIATVYPTFLYYDASLLITGLMVLLATVVIWFTVRAQEKPTGLNFALLGAFIGLSALARPNILLFLPALSVWFWICIRPQFHHRLKNTLIGYALVVVSALVVIAPVTVRNWMVSGDFILISWQGGYNFFLGNNHQASGWSATAPGIKSTWQGGYLDAINLAQTESGRALSEKEVDTYWWKRGVAEVTEHPAAFVKLMAKKCAYFFGGFEIPNNQNIYLVERYSKLADALFWREPFFFPSGLIIPLALLGLGLSLRRWRKYTPLYLFVLSYFVSIVIFFVCARYRQPVMPVMLLFAAFGFTEIYETIKGANWRRLGALVTIALSLGALCNYDTVGLPRTQQDATDEFLLGSVFQLQNDNARAEKHFRQALTFDPSYADAHINLGLLAAQDKRNLEAEKYFQTALRLEPNNSLALTNLAMLHMTGKKLAEARRLLERAREIDGLDFNIHYRLGLVYHLQEDYARARESYLEAFKLNPDFAPIKQNLQIVEEILSEGATVDDTKE